MRGARKVPPKRDPKARRFEGTRDDAHLERVKQLRCVIAGLEVTVVKFVGVYPKEERRITYRHVCDSPSQPHHVDLKAQGGHDHSCIPACDAAHKEIHQHGPTAFEKKWGVSLAAEAAKLAPQRTR